jgi:hypothetical protein
MTAERKRTLRIKKTLQELRERRNKVANTIGPTKLDEFFCARLTEKLAEKLVIELTEYYLEGQQEDEE